MKKTIFILLLLLSLGTMHYFSSRDGVTSNSQSNAVIDIVDQIRDKVTLRNENLIKIKDVIINKLRKYNKSFLVRKAAHFSMYAIIGGLLMIVVYSFLKNILISAKFSFICTALYAIFDEVFQLTVNGRAGSIKDVIIDSTGAFFSILIISIILLTKQKLKRKI